MPLQSESRIVRHENESRETRFNKDYFLRWRIFARMRRFLRPCFRRPFPDFLVPKASSVCIFCDCRQSNANHDSSVI